ncbi:MAG TPA: metallophosphoesterase [Verrucomicrobia bacterium]|nr:metallophosphoesterase [Verrucomicrobiales bacterium]HIL55111.1 metallophosphoesterase [Verrucomicrobiota bacterium]
MRLSILLATFISIMSVSGAMAARGTVFHDKNQNGQRDKGEPGIKNIGVSNGKEVTKTNDEGAWELPHDEDTIFFVIKPRDWSALLNKHNLPQFYYIHKPEGSPKKLKYKGLEPTGPLPESINFALSPKKEPDTFKAIFFGDPQPSTIKQINYIAHDIIAELVGTDAKFGVTLGDIMDNNLDLFPPSNANLALIGIPWYNLVGNHDINFDSQDDAGSDETFHRFFGPNYYSFDHGPVHFIVLDDVEWSGKRGNYKGGLDEDQLTFVKHDLALVPQEKLIVLMMHIPLINVGNRQKLYRLIEKRPYTMSISGHTHWHAHKLIDEKDGWKGKEPHHHIINVCVSGTWWKGNKDEVAIPHATMRDGAPNGYSIITFDGTKHTLDFKAARQPASYQLSIHAPDQIDPKNEKQQFIYVNVFNGSAKSKVKMRIGEGTDWIPLKKTVENDPYYVELRERETLNSKDGKTQLNPPSPSNHLWKVQIPAGIETGSHLIEIEATDHYGRPHKGNRIIRVEK